jgi:predicted nucleic acid-binding protein
VSILLDSDVVIEILRSRDQVVVSQWSALASSNAEILFSPVTAAEIWAGARENEFPATSRFFEPLACVPISHQVGRLAGEFLRQFSGSHGLKIGDALIAATAVRYQASLWTRNRKHYPMPQLNFY